MSKQFSPQTEEQRREGLFRFGQRFTLENLRFRIRRDSLVWFLIYGLPKEAFGDGFDIVKPDTEEAVEWNKEFQEESEKHYDEGINGVSLEMEGGQSLAAFMTKGGNLKLWAFATDTYEIYYKDVSGEIEGGKMDLQIANQTNVTKMSFGNSDKITKIDGNHIKLEKVYEILTRPDPKLKNAGIPLLEPAWDAIIARYMLISHSAYNIARGGAGMKKQTIKESALKDANLDIASLVDNISKYGSSHDSTVDVVDEQGNPVVKTEIEPYSGSLPMKEFHEEYLIDIMFSIGLPVAVLRGLTPGELVGAEVNESSYFDALEDLQAKYHAYWMWYAKQVAVKIGKEEDFDIKWKSRRDLTTQTIEKLEAFKNITGRTPKIELVADLLGLKIEESDLEEKEDPMMLPGADEEPKEDLKEDKEKDKLDAKPTTSTN